MPQAKTLTQAELDQVLRYVSTKQYAARNRLLVLMSFWSGMRVGEIAALRICDVRNEDGTIKAEVRLAATQTKGRFGRVVLLNERLRDEVAHYLRSPNRAANLPLFPTAKKSGFTANTPTQWFYWTYKKAGIAGVELPPSDRTVGCLLMEAADELTG